MPPKPSFNNLVNLISWDKVDKIQAILDQHPECVDMEGRFKETALHLAALHGKPRITTILLDYKANVEKTDNIGNNTPLHYTAYRGKTNTARILLCHGANPNTKNSDGKTALDIAKSRNKAEMVKLLEEAAKSTSSLLQLCQRQVRRNKSFVPTNLARTPNFEPDPKKRRIRVTINGYAF